MGQLALGLEMHSGIKEKKRKSIKSLEMQYSGKEMSCMVAYTT